MSNFLAVATVTAVLREVLTDAIAGAVPGAKVDTVSPAETQPKPPNPGVNIFLYAVSPDLSHRNLDVPTRRASGELAQRPQAALDLHYLLTFYGDAKKLEPQRLLGRVVGALHAQPTLPPARIRTVIAADAALHGSDLGDDGPPVRFTPAALSLEDLSKLWSVMLQQPYALSAVYQASLVLVEPFAGEVPSPALPVAARNVYVVPVRRPRIERVEDATSPTAPITTASTVAIVGQALAAEQVVVRLAGTDLPPADVTDGRVLVALAAAPPGVLRAGVMGVQIVLFRALGTPPVSRPSDESDVAPLVLHPTVLPHSPNPADPEHDIVFTPAGGGAPPRIRVGVAPDVGHDQRVRLLLNPLGAAPGAPAYAFDAAHRDADSAHVTFDVPGVTAGSYLVRVSVDGAESPLLQDAGGAFIRPRVVVP